MMKIGHFALCVIGAGTVARLVLDHQHQRRQLALSAANMHQRLAADAAAHPEWYADNPTIGELSELGRARALHTNRVIALIAAKHRAKLVTTDELHFNLVTLAQDPAARLYWEHASGYRTIEAESGDRIDRRFNRALTDAFKATAKRQAE
ncbi:DUF6082 family protein [Kitasatospora sp. NPDC086801]|uniref:DUF6082 family protein n=1 Tax=Kitasatospora sp. NPDC086801 TaxID=3364066 RepID=UPI00382B93D0